MYSIAGNRKIAFVLAVFSVAFFGLSLSNIPNTFARYIVSSSKNMSIDVAKPLLLVDVASPSDTLDPSNNININFSVKNFDNNSSLSEVPLEYYLSFSNSASIPLSYSLKNNSSNETVPLDSTNKTTVAATIPTSQTTHNYTLTISWDSSAQKSADFANLTSALVITADVKQSFRGSL